MSGRRKRKRPARQKPNDLAYAQRLFDRGDLRGAERACDKLLAKQPDAPKVLHLAGMVAHKAGRTADALPHLERAASLSPENAGMHGALGMALVHLGEADRAAASFRRALEIAPGTLGLVFNLGVALEDGGRTQEAAAAYAEAVVIDPNNARAHYNHARMLEALGRTSEAETAYRSALELQADYPKALNNLANLLRGRPGPGREEALYLYEEANALEPGFAGAWKNRGLLLSDLGRVDEARECFAKAHELDPDDATAAHMLAALSGDSPSAAPTEYVASLFDEYAPSFDAHLTGELAYSVPRVLGDMLAARCGPKRGHGLDLGCGTGLFGERMRPFCERLVGVDLSAKMVAVAQEKGIYDEVAVGDIAGFLEQSSASFDVIAAADVFAYCGDLAPIFEFIAERLAPGGLFAFSTEATDEGDLVLRKTGRFAHRREHVLSLATEQGMTLLDEARIPVRAQHGKGIDGDVMLFSGR